MQVARVVEAGDDNPISSHLQDALGGHVVAEATEVSQLQAQGAAEVDATAAKLGQAAPGGEAAPSAEAPTIGSLKA